MFATPAEADGKKHHRHHYWEDEGRYRYTIGRGTIGATGTIDLTIADMIESLTTTDRTIIAAQYSNSGSDRTKVVFATGDACAIKL